MTRRDCLLLSLAAFAAPSATAQTAGIGEGMVGELRAVASLLDQLASAFPADKYPWRPAEGIQSVAELFLHVATTNFYLMQHIGVPTPKGFEVPPVLEGASGQKATATEWLRVSTRLVLEAYIGAGREALQTEIRLFNKPTTVEGVFLRSLAHMNQHLGQAIAYARMQGVTPPWSQRA